MSGLYEAVNRKNEWAIMKAVWEHQPAAARRHEVLDVVALCGITVHRVIPAIGHQDIIGLAARREFPKTNGHAGE